MIEKMVLYMFCVSWGENRFIGWAMTALGDIQSFGDEMSREGEGSSPDKVENRLKEKLEKTLDVSSYELLWVKEPQENPTLQEAIKLAIKKNPEISYLLSKALKP